MVPKLGSGSYEESNRPLAGRCFGFVGGSYGYLVLRLRGRVQLYSMLWHSQMLQAVALSLRLAFLLFIFC